MNTKLIRSLICTLFLCCLFSCQSNDLTKKGKELFKLLKEFESASKKEFASHFISYEEIKKHPSTEISKGSYQNYNEIIEFKHADIQQAALTLHIKWKDIVYLETFTKEFTEQGINGYCIQIDFKHGVEFFQVIGYFVHNSKNELKLVSIGKIIHSNY